MHRIRHINALPGPCLDTVVNNVARLGQDASLPQHTRERRADPFCDIRPTFLASDLRDLILHRHALQVRQGQDQWPRDRSIYYQAPVAKAASLQALELFSWRLYRVGK